MLDKNGTWLLEIIGILNQARKHNVCHIHKPKWLSRAGYTSYIHLRSRMLVCDSQHPLILREGVL